jgi:DNA-binding Lrp family transcriptional regulator
MSEMHGFVKMRNTEWKLVSELMKNSRRSDRDLAKVIGVSQPTITRMRARLEKAGYIKEYTMIPDFKKLGYEILAITFLRVERAISEDELENYKKVVMEGVMSTPVEMIMIERVGPGIKGVVLSYHRNYSSYAEFRDRVGQYSSLGVGIVEEYVVNLNDKHQFLPLTFALFAKNMKPPQQEEEYMDDE